MRAMGNNKHAQIGHVTCDNASNNDTMMEFFAKYIETRRRYHFHMNHGGFGRHLLISCPSMFHYLFPSCLAHVINLATQALIKGYSNSEHYNPAKPNDHLPDTDALIRDEVGLVRAIAVKVIL
jgi:hypothetical protein